MGVYYPSIIDMEDIKREAKMERKTYKDTLYREIAGKRMIMEIPITVYYPLTGGYNSKPYSSLLGLHLPEAKDFKYLWRWWSRVFLNDNPSNNYEILEEKVMRMLGGTKKHTGISRLSIQVEYDQRFSILTTIPISHIEIEILESNEVDKVLRYIENTCTNIKNSKASKCRAEFHVRDGNIYLKILQIDQTNKSGKGRKGKKEARKLLKEQNIINLKSRALSNLATLVEDLETLIKTKDMDALIRLHAVHLPYVNIRVDSGGNIMNRKKVKWSIKDAIMRSIQLALQPSRVEMRVRVYLRSVGVEKDYEEVAKYLKFLLASLLFGSIGRRSSRGLGSIVPPDDPNEIKLSLRDDLEYEIRSSYKSLIKTLLCGKCEVDINDIREILGLRSQISTGKMPNIPMLDPEYSFIMRRGYPPTQQPIDLLRIISDEFNHHAICSKAFKNSNSQNTHLCELIHGSPRKSPYAPKRRRSAISYKILPYPRCKWLLSIGFLSRDIIHIGQKNNQILDTLGKTFKDVRRFLRNKFA